jgi:hypothetical protein
VDGWVAPCQAPGQGRPAHRHAHGSTPRLARLTASAHPCPRAHASYVAIDGRVGLWHGWILVAAGDASRASMGRVARAPADARHTAQGEEDGGPLPLPSRAYAHAPIPPRIPLRMRSSAYMRVPVSHHARVSVCVCARARLGGRVRERNADGGWGQAPPKFAPSFSQRRFSVPVGGRVLLPFPVISTDTSRPLAGQRHPIRRLSPLLDIIE